MKCNYLNGSCIKVQPLYFITYDFRSVLIRFAAFLWCEAIHIINLLHSPQWRGGEQQLHCAEYHWFITAHRLLLPDMLMMEMFEIIIDRSFSKCDWLD